eukprot:760224-Hanusia_phi.AAC.2
MREGSGGVECGRGVVGRCGRRKGVEGENVECGRRVEGEVRRMREWRGWVREGSGRGGCGSGVEGEGAGGEERRRVQEILPHPQE